MGKKKAGYSNVRAFRLSITYKDSGGQRILGMYQGEHMAGARVLIGAKVFPGNGKMWLAPEMELTMPKKTLEKMVLCQTIGSKKRKSYSRHDK